jgi:hypothetical protein
MNRINAPGQGRPRVYATDFPVYDSMEQCSAATGIPFMALKLAKKNGCLFVRHGRVHLGEFIAWFFSAERGENKDGEDDNVDWSRMDKKYSAQLKEIKVEEERERVIDFALASRFIVELTSVGMFGELERLRDEFPAALKGKTQVQISAEVSKQIDEIRKGLDKRLTNWEKKKGKA